MRENKIKFFKKGVSFVIIFIGLLLIINLAYLKLIQPQKKIMKNDLIYKQFLNSPGGRELNFAFFGDSHTGSDVNPSYVNNSFNFAQDGENYIETYYKLKKITGKDKVKIKNIILEVDLHTFSDKIQAKERLFQQLYFYSQMVSLNDISRLRGESLLSVFLQKNILFLGKGSEFVENILIHSGLIRENTQEVSLNENDIIRHAEKSYKGHFGIDSIIKINKQTFNYFLNILRIAKENNINVIFIKYPVSKEYDLETEKHNLGKKEYYNEIFAEVDKILDKYAILDYYNIFFNRLEYFFDSQHLNKIGSEVFSKKINDDFKKYQQD